jgi:hypothetical protein
MTISVGGIVHDKLTSIRVAYYSDYDDFYAIAQRYWREAFEEDVDVQFTTKTEWNRIYNGL